MLQIFGESMLIATRMDSHLPDYRRTPARPIRDEVEAEEPRARRRGWLHIAGILL
jgi:hypothetical protein